MSPNLEKLLPTLVGAGVEFIIVGGVAGAQLLQVPGPALPAGIEAEQALLVE